MKKRYLLLIPVAACIIVCAALIGYIQFHPEQAPEGTEFLARLGSQTSQTDDAGSASPDEEQTTEPEEETKETEQEIELTASQKRAQELTEGMTLEQKLYQMLFVTPESLTGSNGAVIRAGNTTQSSLASMPVGGILYERQNLQRSTQVTDMLTHTQEYAAQSGAGIPVFTGIQETAGLNPVSRTLSTTAFENASAYGETGNEDGVYEMGKTLASDLGALGFNVDFAPIAELAGDTASAELFGSDAQTVSALAAKQVQGLQEGGMLSAVSCFPGTGGGTAEERLSVFEACTEQNAAIMIVTNSVLSEYDTVPCSASEQVVTELLRGELGYTGIVMTDALNAAGLENADAEAALAVQAVQAGVDMLLAPSDPSAVYQALADAVSNGTISEARIDESVQRILTAKLDYGFLT